jgi:hypothetical protein
VENKIVKSNWGWSQTWTWWPISIHKCMNVPTGRKTIFHRQQGPIIIFKNSVDSSVDTGWSSPDPTRFSQHYIDQGLIKMLAFVSYSFKSRAIAKFLWIRSVVNIIYRFSYILSANRILTKIAIAQISTQCWYMYWHYRNGCCQMQATKYCTGTVPIK